MTSLTIRRQAILASAGMILIALVSVFGGSGVQAQAGIQATEAATLVATAQPTAISIPAVNWNDVSAYKADMKPNHAADVDKAANDNRYVIVASLSIENDAVIRAGERIRYMNRSKETLNEIVYRLYPNLPMLAGRLDVSNVTVANQPVTPSFTESDSTMSLPLSNPLAPGQSVEMTLNFTLVMTRDLDAAYGRFGFVHNVVSATAWYPTLSVYDEGRGWWKAMPSPAGDPAYTETGLYDVRLTTPGDMTVVMSGTDIETIKNADGTVTYHDVTGPMRDHAFEASTRYAIQPLDVEGTRINIVHYRDPANPATDATASVVKYATQAMQTYNKVYGEFPFKEFDVVENPTPTGVEFPGLIQISERAWGSGGDFLEIVVAHETAHQWFYSLVGNDQVDHPWLDEALATYTEFVYVRMYYPTQADNYIASLTQGYARYRQRGLPDLPVDMPVTSYTDQQYGAIVYTKGALFYLELEKELGQDTVYKALHEYFRRYEYAVVTSSDLMKTFEEVSGKNLEAVFHEWLGNFDNRALATQVF